MSDVVAGAKTLESAQRTNQLIVDTSKSIDEQVHWTNFKKRHSEMRLKREPNTCHWCGSTQGPHTWSVCPAKGRTCTRCGGNDHFARVCLEPITTSRSEKGTLPKGRGRVQGRGRNSQRRQDQRRPIHSLEDTNLQQQRLLITNAAICRWSTS